ncbi:DUF4397 domain-containing protein [Pedobacter cryoconitis]|uniref:DUF4397 domain-containing protein n=1 Tax=Pedobacter cryoconitis TaxID=188932 RepID=A0A327S9B9_9SPHI|nr:DUF4397 domain-containing protein [Pedobacter cryoconitis]RAJ24554.1 protein of unknown function (DUF4397) [Pedobacter cryoconitis]
MKKSTLNLIVILTIILFSGCHKADYLDVDAGDRPPLSAKVKFVNARLSPVAVNFWDFTRKVTPALLSRNTASAYLDTQFGKVQYNVTEGTNTSYKASYVFGGSANFVQESNTASFSGPNGPIADFAHSLFTVKKRLTSTLNPNNIDSLILVYDDLTLPSPGKAKIRFANFSPDAPSLDFLYTDGAVVFKGVSYGNFGDQVIIPYTNGKSPAVISGLTWKTLGPFKEVDAGTNLSFQLKKSADQGVVPVTGNTLTGIVLENGKIYTLFVNGLISGQPELTATIITHN